MSRDIPTGFSAAVEASTVEVFFAVELMFDVTQQNPSGPLRFWSGLGEVELDGDTYVGSGQMLQVSSVDESLDVTAKGATLTLSGLPSDLLSLALSEPYQGRKCKIYVGMRDASANPMPSESSVMAEVFSGYLDQMNIDEGGETSTIALYVESRLIDLHRPRERRYTSESQKSRFPSDKGFDFVEDLQDKKFQWGRK
jgi:hypothetical protein